MITPPSTARDAPVFGPNGAVMNSPNMTDEQRAEIEASDFGPEPAKNWWRAIPGFISGMATIWLILSYDLTLSQVIALAIGSAAMGCGMELWLLRKSADKQLSVPATILSFVPMIPFYVSLFLQNDGQQNLALIIMLGTIALRVLIDVINRRRTNRAKAR